METGIFTQTIHPSEGKSIVIDNSILIERNKFTEWVSGMKSMRNFSTIHYLDGTIKVRWQEGNPVITLEYKPKNTLRNNGKCS